MPQTTIRYIPDVASQIIISPVFGQNFANVSSMRAKDDIYSEVDLLNVTATGLIARPTMTRFQPETPVPAGATFNTFSVEVKAELITLLLNESITATILPFVNNVALNTNSTTFGLGTNTYTIPEPSGGWGSFNFDDMVDSALSGIQIQWGGTLSGLCETIGIDSIHMLVTYDLPVIPSFVVSGFVNSNISDGVLSTNITEGRLKSNTVDGVCNSNVDAGFLDTK